MVKCSKIVKRMAYKIIIQAVIYTLNSKSYNNSSNNNNNNNNNSLPIIYKNNNILINSNSSSTRSPRTSNKLVK